MNHRYSSCKPPTSEATEAAAISSGEVVGIQNSASGDMNKMAEVATNATEKSMLMVVDTMDPDHSLHIGKAIF